LALKETLSCKLSTDVIINIFKAVNLKNTVFIKKVLILILCLFLEAKPMGKAEGMMPEGCGQSKEASNAKMDHEWS
jgi:hypothetical protein